MITSCYSCASRLNGANAPAAVERSKDVDTIELFRKQRAVPADSSLHVGVQPNDDERMMEVCEETNVDKRVTSHPSV